MPVNETYTGANVRIVVVLRLGRIEHPSFHRAVDQDASYYKEYTRRRKRACP